LFGRFCFQQAGGDRRHGKDERANFLNPEFAFDGTNRRWTTRKKKLGHNGNSPFLKLVTIQLAIFKTRHGPF